MSGEPVGGDRVGDAGAAVVELLEHEARVEGAETGATQLLGDGEVHQPELPRLAHDVVGEGLLFVVLRGDRDDLVGGEPPRGVLELLLLGGEVELHHGSC